MQAGTIKNVPLAKIVHNIPWLEALPAFRQGFLTVSQLWTDRWRLVLNMIRVAAKLRLRVIVTAVDGIRIWMIWPVFCNGN
jgi:hypothetical protein